MHFILLTLPFFFSWKCEIEKLLCYGLVVPCVQFVLCICSRDSVEAEMAWGFYLLIVCVKYSFLNSNGTRWNKCICLAWCIVTSISFQQRHWVLYPSSMKWPILLRNHIWFPNLRKTDGNTLWILCWIWHILQ